MEFIISLALSYVACDIFILATFMLGQASTWSAEEPSPTQISFFEEKIRPVLAAKCYKCHSDRARKIKGKLKLSI